jgi:hypothetical protein
MNIGDLVRLAITLHTGASGQEPFKAGCIYHITGIREEWITIADPETGVTATIHQANVQYIEPDPEESIKDSQMEIDRVLSEMTEDLEEMFFQFKTPRGGPLAVLLKDMRDLMIAKGHDYSGRFHAFKNFEWSAELRGSPVDAAFLDRMALKFARQVALQTQDDAPLWESSEQSWIDLANYIVLYIAWQRFKKQGNSRQLAFPQEEQK